MNVSTIALNLKAIVVSFVLALCSHFHTPTPHQPQLISHKIQHAYFLNIFLKVPLLHITQPCYFLPGPLQDCSQLLSPAPTNLFFTLWPEWWADNNTTTSKHSPFEHPQLPLDFPKTQTRCINQEYSAFLQSSQTHLSKSSEILPKGHTVSQFCALIYATFILISTPHNTHNMYTIPAPMPYDKWQRLSPWPNL